MDYSELTDKIKAGEISVGDTLWVVDFRYDNLLNKPTRNLVPTEVVVFQNTDAYIADFHFRPYGKSGKVTAQKITTWGSGGRNHYATQSIGIFHTEEEANEYYIAQCETIQKNVNREQARVTYVYNEILVDIKKRITEAKKV